MNNPASPVVIDQDQPSAQAPGPPVELVTISADELKQLRSKASIVTAVSKAALRLIGLLAVLTAIVCIVAILAD